MFQVAGPIWVVLGLLFLSGGRENADVNWLHDLGDGQRLAARERKDLLINFTGTEWCRACTQFEFDVLNKPVFSKVEAHWVLVELNFPASDDELPEELRAKYLAWREQYGIRGFPTVILADADGKPYAVTGHIELDVKQYVRHLEKLREAKTRRDAALAKAADAEGVEKAKRLDEALSALRGAFDEDFTHDHGDPLVQFYRPEIDRVVALDRDNAAGLRDKYQKVLHEEHQRQRVQEIYDRLKKVEREEGFASAIKLLDREVEQADSTELRNRLRSSRLVYLEWSDRHEEALAFAKELARDDGYTAAQKRRLRERVAYNLMQLERMDEAVAVLDQLIAEAKGDPKVAWSPCRKKADWLMSRGRHAESLEAWEDAIRYVKRGTLDWIDCQFFRAKMMIKLGRHDDAISVLDETIGSGSLNPLSRAHFLAETAAVLTKGRRRGEALERVRQAEKVLAEADPRRVDEDYVKRIRSILETARGETTATGGQRKKEEPVLPD